MFLYYGIVATALLLFAGKRWGHKVYNRWGRLFFSRKAIAKRAETPPLADNSDEEKQKEMEIVSEVELQTVLHVFLCFIIIISMRFLIIDEKIYI